MDQKYAYLGVGLKFPVVIDQFGRPEMVSGIDLVRQSIIEILCTILKTRYFLPEFGSRVNFALFLQNTDVLQGVLSNYIHTALGDWEKRITVSTITVVSDSPEKLLLRVNYKILQSNEFDTFDFPFFKN